MALVAEQFGQLEHGGGADDRRCQQEGEPGRVFVREADEEAAAHGGAGAGEAWNQGKRLRGPDEESLRETDLSGDPGVIVGGGLRGAAPQRFGAEESCRPRAASRVW